MFALNIFKFWQIEEPENVNSLDLICDKRFGNAKFEKLLGTQ